MATALTLIAGGVIGFGAREAYRQAKNIYTKLTTPVPYTSPRASYFPRGPLTEAVVTEALGRSRAILEKHDLKNKKTFSLSASFNKVAEVTGKVCLGALALASLYYAVSSFCTVGDSSANRNPEAYRSTITSASRFPDSYFNFTLNLPS